jgi:glycosyltransferase involved in cell wall biosynthesis
MHIAHFTNTYKPNVNGVVRSVDTFRDAFLRLGHSVFIFAQQHRDYQDKEPFIFRYPAVKIPGFDYSAPVPISPYIDQMLPSLKLDIIHSNHPILLGSAAANFAEELGLPLVYTFHTRYVEYAASYTVYVPFIEAFVEGIIVDELVKYIRRCHHVITPSDSIKKNLEEYGGVTGKVTTIPTGIDVARFRAADGRAVRERHGLTGRKVLVTVCRLAEEKNVATMVLAAAQVLKEQPDARLLVVGDGPARNDLEKLAEESGVAAQVVFAGLVPFDEVPDYLKAANVFCYASVTETQGLVTMEAMASGLPVVAVDATGTSDVVQHGQEGLLTANDADALASALESILCDEALYDRLAAAALAKSTEFDMMRQAERMLEVYGQAIEDNKAGRKVRVDPEAVKASLRQTRH